MIYLSIAIAVSVALICIFGIDIDIYHTYENVTDDYVPEITFKDLYSDEGDPEYEEQVTMDEYIRSMNDLMVGNDKEIE